MAHTTKPEIVQLLRRINEGATNSQTPLGEVLRLCLRLGTLLQHKELSDWAKAEAGGYESAASLPDYRIFEAEVRGTFSGPYGTGIDNAVIPRVYVEENHRNSLFKVYIMQSVGELEQLAAKRGDTNSITIPWSGDAIMHYQRKTLYEGQVLVAARKVITTTLIAGILEVIRIRVLEFVLMIEGVLGIDMMNDDIKTPLESPPQDRLNQIFNTTIHGGDNIALGNTGTTNQYATHVQPGDLKGLKEKLAEQGVTVELLNELDTALSKDADSEEQPGSHVQGWLTRFMIKAGKGTLQLASASATTIVMTELRRFLGLPPV